MPWVFGTRKQSLQRTVCVGKSSDGRVLVTASLLFVHNSDFALTSGTLSFKKSVALAVVTCF